MVGGQNRNGRGSLKAVGGSTFLENDKGTTKEVGV